MTISHANDSLAANFESSGAHASAGRLGRPTPSTGDYAMAMAPGGYPQPPMNAAQVPSGALSYPHAPYEAPYNQVVGTQTLSTPAHPNPAAVAFRVEASDRGHNSDHTLFVEHPAPAMRHLRELLSRVAPLHYPLLICGETGTGKDLAARYVHELSNAQLGHGPERAFHAVNCGAIPGGLAESELFGHLRGAFTGAHRNHCGAFVAAGHGTLFLDEVGELPLDLQAKLLRVLETGRVRPVGGEREIEVHCRVIAATHRDLPAMVQEGSFREDLYHRLAIFEARVPALRERAEEIPQLIVKLATDAAHELGRPIEISPRAIEAAQRHPWPGNVRALRNCLMRAAALTDGPIDAGGLIPETRAADRAAMIQIPRGSYSDMKHALLQTIVGEQGSIRRAAKALDVPRSTLGTWLRRGAGDVE